MRILSFFSICFILSLFQISCSTDMGSSGDDSGCPDISGFYSGSYECVQGVTGLDLTIRQEDCSLAATFEFYAVELNPDVPSGSFNMIGQIGSTGLFDLEGTTWISQPEGYIMTDILGELLNNKEDQLRVTICGNPVVIMRQ